MIRNQTERPDRKFFVLNKASSRFSFNFVDLYDARLISCVVLKHDRRRKRQNAVSLLSRPVL